MAHVGNGAAAEEEEDCFEDAYDRIPAACQMDLQTAIQETQCALSLVLNNKLSESLDLLKPWWRDSIYHAMAYSSILMIQATMTFEHRDIQTAMVIIKEALNTCQRFRKRNSMVGSLSSLMSKQSNLQEEEMHAELCYAECLLQKAVLTFIQDENMISFIKGGIKIRTSYKIYKDCQNMLGVAQDLAGQSDLFRQFESGVKLGIGAFNLMLSLLPQRILRLLEFIGFSGNREFGLSQLREGASSHSLRSVVCSLTLLFYHTYISLILGTAEGNLVEAEALLEPFQHKYPKGFVILFYSARISTLRGNFEKARAKYEECISCQQEWKQVHHVCYWELMWTHSYQQEWQQAYRYADLLCKESRWSKAIYVYQKAAILSMMSEEEAKKTGEDIVELFRQVEGLKQRVAGKSIPTEKFAVRKSRRYKAANPVPLVVPILEMMYFWNSITIIGKRADCTEALLITIEAAEEQLRNDPNPTEFHPDDSCLVQMLKGLCLKHLGRLLQAELCFTQVLSSESRIRYDHYLIPFTLYELGLLYKQQGDFTKATAYIKNAKMNYKDYSMESRLHFKIHAALHSLKGSPVGTP
uniref:Tetratricopeptide repeat protein 39B n=2 Tax=Monopterus albus TaxID=43700 RepID=A0A3Q3IU67_MONAL|nr:tetratricopeptide repeat protein 39B-like isoform X3 [Monopterus albus]